MCMGTTILNWPVNLQKWCSDTNHSWHQLPGGQCTICLARPAQTSGPNVPALPHEHSSHHQSSGHENICIHLNCVECIVPKPDCSHTWWCHWYVEANMNTCGTDNPKISVLIQKQLRYTGSIKSEMSRDSKNAFLHCGDVLAHADKKSQQARK